MKFQINIMTLNFFILYNNIIKILTFIIYVCVSHFINMKNSSKFIYVIYVFFNFFYDACIIVIINMIILFKTYYHYNKYDR